MWCSLMISPVSRWMTVPVAVDVVAAGAVVRAVVVSGRAGLDGRGVSDCWCRSAGAVGTLGVVSASGAVVEPVQDLDIGAVGEEPVGEVGLPGIVRLGGFEPDVRRTRSVTACGLVKGARDCGSTPSRPRSRERARSLCRYRREIPYSAAAAVTDSAPTRSSTPQPDASTTCPSVADDAPHVSRLNCRLCQDPRRPQVHILFYLGQRLAGFSSFTPNSRS